MNNNMRSLVNIYLSDSLSSSEKKLLFPIICKAFIDDVFNIFENNCYYDDDFGDLNSVVNLDAFYNQINDQKESILRKILIEKININSIQKLEVFKSETTITKMLANYIAKEKEQRRIKIKNDNKQIELNKTDLIFIETITGSLLNENYPSRVGITIKKSSKKVPSLTFKFIRSLKKQDLSILVNLNTDSSKVFEIKYNLVQKKKLNIKNCRRFLRLSDKFNLRDDLICEISKLLIDRM